MSTAFRQTKHKAQIFRLVSFEVEELLNIRSCLCTVCLQNLIRLIAKK